MRAYFICALLSATILTINAVPAQAQPGRMEALVDGVYQRYLQRPADATALRVYTDSLLQGAPLEAIEAAVLSGPEYYQRNGATPEGYVAALYRDVLGRRAGSHEFQRSVDCVLSHGRRSAATRVLNQRGVAPASVIVASPPPVLIAQPAPVIVTQPVIVARPYAPPPAVVVGPPHRHHVPVYVSPVPGVSIRFNIR